MRAPRKATDKRTVGTAKNPRKVASPSAAQYKGPPVVVVAKSKKVGRPRKAQ